MEKDKKLKNDSKIDGLRIWKNEIINWTREQICKEKIWGGDKHLFSDIISDTY